MDEKLILQIQATLKDLIYSKRKVRENLLWTLNMQIEELRKPFVSEEIVDLQFPEYKIAEKLNIDILYCVEEDMNLYKHSTYIKYEDTFLRRNIFAIYSSLTDKIISKKYLKTVEIIRPLHYGIEVYCINMAIGHCILNYGTNKNIFYPIYEMQEMFFRNKEERVLDLFARTLLLPTSFILECLSRGREKDFKYKKNLNNWDENVTIKTFNICWNHATGLQYFSPVRIQEVRELIADISVTRPKVYEEIKAKYPLLFSDY